MLYAYCVCCEKKSVIKYFDFFISALIILQYFSLCKGMANLATEIRKRKQTSQAK